MMNITNTPIEMIFLSEYCNKDKTAHVFRRISEHDYVAIGFINGIEKQRQSFLTENQSEDWAEDWVLNETS